MGPDKIDTLPAKMAAVRAALATAMPTRIHKAGYQRDFDEHRSAELRAGVVQVVAGDESDYSQQLGRTATEGTFTLAVVIQLLSEETDDGSQIEAAELAAGEDLKAFVRTGITGLDIGLERLTFSAQQETPYGFTVAQITAGPPRDNLN